MSSSRLRAVSAVLPDGRVLVAGGSGATGLSTSQIALSSSEIFDPANDTWSPGPSMSSPRVGAVAVTLANGDVLVAGGNSSAASGAALDTAEVYNPTLNTFSLVSNTMTSGRFLPAAALLPNGDVLIVGGQDQNGNTVSTADLYDPTTNAFVTGAGAPPDMSTPRELPSATTLDNGDVLVAGGATSNLVPLDTAEVYDPNANSWAPVSNLMSSPRIGGAVAGLPGGRELVIGGITETTPSEATTSTTDIYSLSTNTFTPGPSMDTPRAEFGIDQLHDGRVLVMGGLAVYDGAPAGLFSAELFDPATNQWSAAGSLPQPLVQFATDPLHDGQVLVAGGSAGLLTATARAWLYTPASVPAAPVAVSATAGDGSALVTFGPPADDGGEPITGYTISASTGQTVMTPDTRTFATVRGLTNGTAVTFTVRAINAEGTGPASAPSNSITPASSSGAPASSSGTPARPVSGAVTDRAPRLRLSRLPTHLSLKRFLRGLRFAVTPNKPASLQIMLRGTVNQATIADAFDLTLAHRTLGISGAKRTITLRPSRKLVGDPRRVKVELVIVADDAAGSRSTTTRTITIRG